MLAFVPCVQASVASMGRLWWGVRETLRMGLNVLLAYSQLLFPVFQNKNL